MLGNSIRLLLSTGLRRWRRWQREPWFSIDVILAYMARLMLIEQYNELDERKGADDFRDVYTQQQLR